MPDLETTQSKLRGTPTAGVSGEHSAYYRRLLSAGYKGYVQGAVGGATLYGSIGAAIGAIVGIPLLVVTAGAAVPLLPLLLIPALGVGFGLYGGHMFADIGKTAAIIADSAETNEKRRYLWDRYLETPSEEEAREIKSILEEEYTAKAPERFFHLRPAVIGAALGIALALTVIALAPYFAPTLVPELLGFLGIEIAGHTAAVGLGLAAPIAAAAGAAIGGLGGAMIGIDREYVRRWLDKAEFVVHDPKRAESELAQREHEIQRLTDAAGRDVRPMPNADMKIHLVEPEKPARNVEEAPARACPISPRQIAGLENRPTTSASSIEHQDRVVSVQEAMARPVV